MLLVILFSFAEQWRDLWGNGFTKETLQSHWGGWRTICQIGQHLQRNTLSCVVAGRPVSCFLTHQLCSLREVICSLGTQFVKLKNVRQDDILGSFQIVNICCLLSLSVVRRPGNWGEAEPGQTEQTEFHLGAEEVIYIYAVGQEIFQMGVSSVVGIQLPPSPWQCLGHTFITRCLWHWAALFLKTVSSLMEETSYFS